MVRRTRRTRHWSLSSLLLTGTLLTAAGCSPDPADTGAAADALKTQAQAAEPQGETKELDSLPYIEPEKASKISLQQLEKVTQLEENVALHMLLPPPTNKELEGSLVRVMGEPESPVLLVRSDALKALGQIPESPGPEFFTLFSRLDSSEISRRIQNERDLAAGKQGRVTDRNVIFDGRTPVAVSKGLAFNLDQFNRFIPQPLSLCPATPVSTMQGWGESLFITSPAVVLDPARTWDPCTGAGTQGGVWTFAHLMRQMAMTSGHTPETFVLKWLEDWLNPQTINGDVVPARLLMFNQVIQPWAIASGHTATLSTDATGHRFVTLSGPLNLNIAPFRLTAIVNRIDLGDTVTGASGYGGATTSRPVDAGELRFIFNIVQPNPWGAGTQATCGIKQATAIFEYGVPITGCSNVVQWARDWTQLNTFGGFNAAYLTHLQTLTESVVLHGKAPTKGNKNALNQLRTNELPLGGVWELREFTLTDENPAAGTDMPSDGLLRRHTVAQTPNDTAFPFVGNATNNAFVLGPVKATVPAAVGPLPANCSSAHTVPYSFGGGAYRGGNSLVPNPFTHWEAFGANAADPRDVCARHQFSLNTCSGCHGGDTLTLFTHVTTGFIPVSMSSFLTGGGPGLTFGVGDTQFGAPPTWRFADLERRWKRLHELAFCTQCTNVISVGPAIVDRIKEIAQVVPIDPIGPVEKPFPVGPIRDLEHVKKILDVRREFAKDVRSEPVDFIRPAQQFVH
ncbi:MAG: hypothetical protein JXB05_08295 [Myxococcaceae bacterium]|nr:hypothetical protein [Myxococcaceae bacterium]